MKKMLHFSLFKATGAIILMLIAALPAYTQTGVKIATAPGTAHSSAMLDVESTNKGVLVPRLTAAQRAAISGPAEGLLVYQTTSPTGYWYFNGSVWIQMGVGAISGSGNTGYLSKWTTGSSLGTAPIYDGGDHLEFMSNVNADDNAYEWHGFYSGSTRQGIILYDGPWSGANSLSNEFSLSAEGSNLLTLNTQANHIALMPKGGNVGIGTVGPAARVHVTGGGMILGTPASGTSSNTRTFTILQDGQGQHSFGSYPGAWTSALQIQSNDNARYLWLSPITAGGNARLVSIGSDFDIMPGNTLAATFTSGGNVGIGTTTPGFRLHVPSGYIGTDYINTSDNVVSSGVTGIMVKAGDNYHRTATAAAIQAFIGSSGADNLGNHTATSYLQMGNQWINFNAGAGLYSASHGNYFWPVDQYYWYMRSDRGMRVFNNAGTSLGYLYHDNSSSFGLLSPNGNWRTRVDNSNTEIYGGYLYAPTSQIGFIYDRDNTGYYLDPAGTSQTSTIYNNSWFRAQGQSGFYFQDYAGGWYMTDGTWIRSYNSRNVYVDAQLRADGGLVSGGIGSLGGGTINANGNIFNSSPSQGTLGLTGDLPGYGTYTYPTVKTSGSYMYLSVGGAYSVYISSGGSYTAVSSRNKKENFEEVDRQDILNKIGELEMTRWNYKNEDPNVKHIGPMAEDFWDKFRLNDNDCMISHIDPSGVALVGVQALNENYKSQQKEIDEMQSTISDFGSIEVTSKELWINFNASFSNSTASDKLPTVTVTSNKPGVNLYVAEKNNKGFKLVVDSDLPQGLSIDYIAMAQSQPKAPEVKKPAKSYEHVVPHHNQRMEAGNLEVVNKPEIIDITAPELAPEMRPELTGANYAKEHAAKVRLAEEAKKNYTAIPEDAPAKSGSLGDTKTPQHLPTSPK